MRQFLLSNISGPKGEIDSFDCYSLPGDIPGEFHIICTNNSMALVSISVRAGGAGFSTREEWRRETKSRSWHVVSDVIDSPSEPAFFTAREDGHFHAYKLDGTPCWSHDFSATVSEFKIYADPFTGERTLLVPSLDKTLRMLVASNGRLVWGDTFQSGVNVVDQCVLDGGDTHVIVAGGNDNTLRCYMRKKIDKLGAYKMVWFHKFESYVRDTSISQAGQVAAVADDGFLKIFDAKSGTVSWRHEHNSFAWKCKLLPGIGKVISTSYQLPLDVDESGQKLGNPGVVACHDLASGRLIWSTKPEDGVNVNAWDFLDEGGSFYIFAGTTGGDVLIMDVGSGHIVQRYALGCMINNVAAFRFPGGRVAIIGCLEREERSLFAGIDQI